MSEKLDRALKTLLSLPPSKALSTSRDYTAQLERYRVALNKIARHSDDRYAREIADSALAGDRNA